MKTISTSKKTIAILLAILMVAAVSTVSAFALTPGTYTPSLLSPPSPAPLHVFDFFPSGASATVAADGVTVSIPVKDLVTVTVYDDPDDPTIETGTVTGAATSTSGYSATFSNGILTVTAPADTAITDFAPAITFTIYINTPGDHGPLRATLTLS